MTELGPQDASECSESFLRCKSPSPPSARKAETRVLAKLWMKYRGNVPTVRDSRGSSVYLLVETGNVGMVDHSSLFLVSNSDV